MENFVPWPPHFTTVMEHFLPWYHFTTVMWLFIPWYHFTAVIEHFLPWYHFTTVTWLFLSFYYRDVTFSTLILFYYPHVPFSTLIPSYYRDGTFVPWQPAKQAYFGERPWIVFRNNVVSPSRTLILPKSWDESKTDLRKRLMGWGPPRPSPLPPPLPLSLFRCFSRWRPRSMYLRVFVKKRLLCRLVSWSHFTTVMEHSLHWYHLIPRLNICYLDTAPDPDIEIDGGPGHPDPYTRGGGGGCVSPKKLFSALWASVWSKKIGETGPPRPRAPPRDPPLLILFYCRDVTFCTLISLRVHRGGTLSTLIMISLPWCTRPFGCLAEHFYTVFVRPWSEFVFIVRRCLGCSHTNTLCFLFQDCLPRVWK